MLSRRLPKDYPSQQEGEKRGFLCKLGEKNKQWKKRWFVLQNDKMYYYRSDTEKLIYFIDMKDAFARLSPNYYPTYAAFDIITPARIYQLIAPSNSDAESWMFHINKGVDFMTLQYKSRVIGENDAILQLEQQINRVQIQRSKHLGFMPSDS